jgi:hypothetical protein
MYRCERFGVVISKRAVCRSLHALSVHRHVRGKDTATALQSVPLHNMQAPVEFSTINVTPNTEPPWPHRLDAEPSLHVTVFCWWQLMLFRFSMLADSETQIVREQGGKCVVAPRRYSDT